MKLSPEIARALREIDASLSDAGIHWLVGGSCGLLLQHVPLAGLPRDLDIYADEPHVARFCERLRRYAVDRAERSETDMYRSILSHFHIEGVQVELVGAFRVGDGKSAYEVRVADVLLEYAPQATVGPAVIRLMPLSHELVFNLLRRRPDRYEAIAETMRRDLRLHLPALRHIVRSNSLHVSAMEELARLLQIAPEHLQTSEERNDSHVPSDPFSS